MTLKAYTKGTFFQDKLIYFINKSPFLLIRYLISYCLMLIGQFVLETGCGCRVPPSRKFFSAQNVSVQFAMEEGWIPPELTLGFLFFTNLKYCKTLIFEPRHEISNNVVCATNKGSDQPAHMHSLIRAFASCLNIL